MSIHDWQRENERLTAELASKHEWCVNADLRIAKLKADLNRQGRTVNELRHRIAEMEARLREEIMESYNGLTSTRQARYSGPEEYADAVLRSEALANSEVERLTAILEKMQLANIKKAEHIAKLETKIDLLEPFCSRDPQLIYQDYALQEVDDE